MKLTKKSQRYLESRSALFSPNQSAKHRFFMGVFSLLVALFMLFACSGGDAGNSDGDGQNDGDCECFDDTDCMTGEVCNQCKCELPNIDCDEPCSRDFDCPPFHYCNTEIGCCEREGDEEDGDTDENPVITDGDETDRPSETDTPTEEDGQTGALEVFFIEPVNLDIVCGTMTVDVDVFAEDLEVERIELWIDGEMAEALVKPDYFYSWVVDGLPDGVYTLEARAYAGEEEARDEIDVTLDQSAPEVTILSPTINEKFCYGETISIALETGDNLHSIETKLGGITQETHTRLTNSGEEVVPFEASLLEVGANTIAVVVKDLCDRETERTVDVTTDEEGPLFTLEGIEWTNPEETVGTADPETPFRVTLSDCSGFEGLRFSVKDNFNHETLVIEDANEFPLELHFNDILYANSKKYPAVFNIQANAFDRFGNATNKIWEVEVHRLKWQYDPQLATPANYKPLAPAAATNGNLFLPFENKLHSVSPDGEQRWVCISFDSPFAHGALVVEAEGFPSSVLLPLANANIAAMIDKDIPTSCFTEYELAENARKPTGIALGAVDIHENGYTARLYYCYEKSSASHCHRIDMTYGVDEVGVESLSFETIWTNDNFPNLYPPVTPVVPMSEIYEVIMVGAGNRVYALSKETGGVSHSASLTLDQKIEQISANPVANGIFLSSERDLRYYKYDLEALDFYSFPTNPTGFSPQFTGGQVISNAEGAIMLLTTQERGLVQKGVVMAYDAVGLSLGSLLWEFEAEGRIGGTPAMGYGDIAYLAGSNSDGNIWAINFYEGVENFKPQTIWRMQLGASITAPLLISPNGDLIVMTEDMKAHAIDIKRAAQDEEPASHSWPQYQSDAQRTGRYYP